MTVLFREGFNAVDECVWMTYEQVLERPCRDVGQNIVVGDSADHLANDRPRSFRFVSDALIELLPRSEVLCVCAVPRDSLGVGEECGNQIGIFHSGLATISRSITRGRY